jgi:cell division protein FtsW (lipid II flippase)
MIAALYGFQQLFFGYSKSEQIWFSSISFTTLFIEGLARPFSIFQSPASFADYMQLSIVALMVLFGNVKNSILKVFFVLLVPIYFYATLITSVRSNWVGIIVSLFLWLFFAFLKNRHFKVLFLIITIVGFSISQFIDFDSNPLSPVNSLIQSPQNERHIELLITDRADAITNPFEEHSLLSRLNLWKFIFDLSLDPFMGLLGRGIGTLNADSIYFTYLAELGYPGFFFIIILTIIFILRGLSLAERSTGNIRSLAQSITIMNITFAIINITGTHIHSFPGDAFFWFFNGIIMKHEFFIRKSLSHHIPNEITTNN